MVKENQLIGAKDIQRVFSIVKKNWWILVLFTGIAVFGGYLYSYKQSNVYAAKTQLLLRTNDEYNQGSVISDVGGYYGRTYVDNSNEKRVILSYDLIKQTIDRLNFRVSYFLVGRIKTEELFQGIPFQIQVNALNDELYESMLNFKVLDELNYEITYQKKGVEKKLKGQFGKENASPDMSLIVTKSQPFRFKSGLKTIREANYLFQVHRTNTLVQHFQASLTVDNPEFTNILELTVRDEIAARGVMFLDTLAKVYIENSLQSRVDINKNTLFYIERQLDEVTDIVNNIEDTLLVYKTDHAIIDLAKEGDQYFQQYIGYDNQRRSLELQKQALDELEQYIIEDKDPQFLPPSLYLISDDPFLVKSVEELYENQLKVNELSVTATTNNFAVQQVQKQVELLKRDMLVYIGNSRTALKDRMAGVITQMESALGNIQEIPEKQRGLTNINRKLKVNEDMYLFLLQRRANTVIARAGIVPDTKIIERARMAGLVSPNRSMIMYLWGGIGAVIALIVIFIRVMFYDRIESYQELKSVTGMPIVGEIIFTPIAEELKVAVDHDPKSPLAESFRTIRTNLQYLAGDVNAKGTMIVITSFNPGEGKTFCSINLAAILAKAERKVLLLELDLHKPRVQKGLGIEADIGVSTVAIGKHTVAEVIKRTQIENLDVVLSGPLPPNPSELLMSGKLKEIIEYGRQHYDYLVVDTPPVGLLSDALVLMQMADANLFVVNIKFAYRNNLNQVHEMVEFHKLKHFGFLLNGVKRKKSRYYYNRYGYGYSYGSYGSYGGGYGSYGSSGRSKKK